MPTSIAKELQKFQHAPPSKPQNAYDINLHMTKRYNMHHHQMTLSAYQSKIKLDINPS